MKKFFKYVSFAILPVLAIGVLMSFNFVDNNYVYQERVKGNGNVTTENRTAGNFEEISTSGVYKVVLQQGSTNSIKVEAENNLLPYIQTEVSGNELEIHTKRGYSIDPTKDITIYITIQQVKKLSASGASGYNSVGTIKSDHLELSFSGATNAKLDLKARKLEAGMSGASKLELSGSCDEVEYRVSGAGNIAALELQAQQAEIGISGSGEAKVNVQKKLDVSISGVGKVKYKGEPAISQSVSGMGRISKI